MFCDDTKLLFTAQNDAENEVKIFCALNHFIQVLERFNLAVNINKTKYMRFSKRICEENSSHSFSVFIDETELEEVNEINFLGINVDRSLTWDTHIVKLLNKLNSSLYLLRRLAPICDLKTLLSVYHAIFHSHISYGLLLWGATSVSNLDSVLIMQKKAVRVIFRLHKDTSCQNFFRDHKIFTIYGQYVFQLLLFIKKNPNLFTTVGSTHCYPTRHGDILQNDLPTRSSTICDKLPTKTGLKYFNSLPKHVRNLDEKNFKKSLKMSILKAAPYNFAEIDNCLKSTHYIGL